MKAAIDVLTQPASTTEAGTPATFSGMVRSGNTEYPVLLRFASKYSLWLRYSGMTPQQQTGIFDGLQLKIDSRTAQSGRCHVVRDETARAGEYRVVAMEGIHDLEKLLFGGRIDVLDNTAQNLPLVLGYKNDIDPRFRDYVSDISYDLSVYRNLFDRLDDEYAAEPEQVANIIQQGIIEHLGPDLSACLDAHIERLEGLIAGFTSEQHGHHGYFLRKQIWSDLLCAPFIARTNLKPRGYIGDSEMMQMCYRNRYEGHSTFGKLLHKHPVMSTAAQAVRNRRELVPQLARALSDRLGAAAQRIKLLSVACGPAMELNDLFHTEQDCGRFHCSLLDQDQQALFEASATVKGLEMKLDSTLSVDFIRESVRTLLATHALRERWGDFHFIYSMGLFDYLTPPVAEAVLKKLYALLLPDGEMVIGNFHINNPTRHYMDYWLDWPLYYRSEQEFLDLAAGLDNASAWIKYDDTGVQMLLRIRKEVT